MVTRLEQLMQNELAARSPSPLNMNRPTMSPGNFQNPNAIGPEMRAPSMPAIAAPPGGRERSISPAEAELNARLESAQRRMREDGPLTDPQSNVPVPTPSLPADPVNSGGIQQGQGMNRWFFPDGPLVNGPLPQDPPAGQPPTISAPLAGPGPGPSAPQVNGLTAAQEMMAARQGAAPTIPPPPSPGPSPIPGQSSEFMRREQTTDGPPRAAPGGTQAGRSLGDIMSGVVNAAARNPVTNPVGTISEAIPAIMQSADDGVIGAALRNPVANPYAAAEMLGNMPLSDMVSAAFETNPFTDPVGAGANAIEAYSTAAPIGASGGTSSPQRVMTGEQERRMLLDSGTRPAGRTQGQTATGATERATMGAGASERERLQSLNEGNAGTAWNSGAVLPARTPTVTRGGQPAPGGGASGVNVFRGPVRLTGYQAQALGPIISSMLGSSASVMNANQSPGVGEQIQATLAQEYLAALRAGMGSIDPTLPPDEQQRRAAAVREEALEGLAGIIGAGQSGLSIDDILAQRMLDGEM